jgi:hypothetical protein
LCSKEEYHSELVETWYHRSCYPDKLKPLPQLLLRHNATFDLVSKYGDRRTKWSEEYGWLPRLMSLSKDPEYLLQVGILRKFGPRRYRRL